MKREAQVPLRLTDLLAWLDMRAEDERRAAQDARRYADWLETPEAKSVPWQARFGDPDDSRNDAEGHDAGAVWYEAAAAALRAASAELADERIAAYSRGFAEGSRAASAEPSGEPELLAVSRLLKNVLLHCHAPGGSLFCSSCEASIRSADEIVEALRAAAPVSEPQRDEKGGKDE